MNDGARRHFLAEHGRVAAQLPGDGWLRSIRAAALESFAGRGLPTPREESWKYTDLRMLEKQRYAVATPSSAGDGTLMQPYLPVGLDAHRLVFVNGQFVAALSTIGALPAGARLEPLSARLTRPDDSLRSQLDATVNGSRAALTDLNTAFMTDGLRLELDDGVALERPLHLLSIAADGMSHLRHLVRLGRGCRATLIEQYVGRDDAGYLTNVVVEARLAEGAHLDRCRLQQESAGGYHLGGFYLDQARDSRARLHSADLGGRLVRNDTESKLSGTGAEIQLHGIYVPTGRQHVDNHTRIDHLAPQCTSREAYKGVLDGHGRGVFNGKIVVHPGAQKTDSEQSSAALLLSKTAEVDAKPELEIYADDVKCAHGATVGQLDEAAVFYLQSRGVDAATARSLLTYSFADDVIRRVGIESLRRYIEKAFLARLPNGQALRELL